MMFYVAASSLHLALETLNSAEKDQYKDNIYTIPALNLNENTKSLKNKLSEVCCIEI